MTWDETVELYDALIARCRRFERKGTKVPSTTANGHMFSMVNKDGELGIRFSKEVQEKYMREWDTGEFRSHGAVMRGYVLVPEPMWDDLDALAEVLNEAYDHVMSL